MKMFGKGQGALFQRAGKRDVPEAAYFGPVARRVKGPKSATERRYEGGANVAAAICRSPALNLSFVNLIPGTFMVNGVREGKSNTDRIIYLSDTLRERIPSCCLRTDGVNSSNSFSLWTRITEMITAMPPAT